MADEENKTEVRIRSGPTAVEGTHPREDEKPFLRWRSNRRTQRNHPVEARKRGPKTAFSDKELTERIRREIAASPFTGEGHRKFWARLRIAGVRTSKTRVLRLMREAQLRAPQRQAAPVVEKAHAAIVTERPNQH